MYRRRFLWAATGAYAVLLAVASVLPSSAARGGGGWDGAVAPPVQNALHVPAYAVLTALGLLVWQARGTRALIVVALCAGYGLSLEAAQAAVPGRMGSAADALWNTIGALAGLAGLAGVRALRTVRAGQDGDRV